MNSKTSFRNTLRVRNINPPVFVPFIYSLAAKIAQIPLEEMVSNATYYTHALETSYKLFKYDAIINSFDTSIEAESLGCELDWSGDYDPPRILGCNLPRSQVSAMEISSRIQTIIEATKRLIKTHGKEAAVNGVITGPCSLVKTLMRQTPADGELRIEDVVPKVGDMLTNYTRSLCESKIDAVFLREDPLSGSFWKEIQLLSKPYARIYTTLFNVIRFYNAHPVLIVRDFKLENIEELYELIKPSGIVLCGNRFNEKDLGNLKDLSDKLGVCFGLTLPMGDKKELIARYDVISGFIERDKPTGFFFTSDGEIPYDVPLETIHDLIGRIRNI